MAGMERIPARVARIWILAFAVCLYITIGLVLALCFITHHPIKSQGWILLILGFFAVWSSFQALRR
jgi:predicted membrane metal-binding protein